MKGFLLDLNRCTGCHACLLACSIENTLGAGNSWRQVHTFNLRHHPGVASFHLSLACLHCSNPACMTACPAGAYTRDPATGAVLIDATRCIGCRYCSWACPFDAPRYSRAEGTISKCTLCNDRLLSGNDPACATLCPTGALRFDELETAPAARRPVGFPAADIGPAIRFTPLRSSDTGPEVTAIPQDRHEAAVTPISDTAAAPKVSVETEWSLIFFSVAAALLVAIASAGIAGSVRIHAIDFLIAALGTLSISALHLGKWRRAWRAVVNLRQSWLSREIVSFAAFTVLASILMQFPATAWMLSWPAALTGFAALFCIDRIYESVSANPWTRLHSARALLTGLFLFGILTASVPIAGLTGLLKLFLYAYRQSWFESKSRALASALRLALGFVAPLALWGVYPEWVLPLVLIAEVVDRCEYYLDLDIVTPQSQVAADLRNAVLSASRK